MGKFSVNHFKGVTHRVSEKQPDGSQKSVSYHNSKEAADNAAKKKEKGQ